MKTINQLQPGDIFYIISQTTALNERLIRRVCVDEVVDLDSLPEENKLLQEKHRTNALRIRASGLNGGIFILIIDKGEDNLVKETETAQKVELYMVFHVSNDVTLTTNPQVAKETATRSVNERIEKHTQSQMQELQKKMEEYKKTELTKLDNYLDLCRLK